ncbi:Glycosyltransferase like family 2 [Loktanella fryxellensis]|uniref:Glycosyltransferase like family 2 n=1 Tax=Loktanella fryxellensis TaxID=245187 RepID=A0A1H8DR17_9RHOB|nr:glycosyltransferase [Loktanella fryxellensis]SEN09771.1 Glycosyltransferase like family 2 [Loktanella fryxellensis]
MPEGAAVSVIVVSTGRPDALRRCLLGLSQIAHPLCEVIVVADAASRPAIAASGLADHVKAVSFGVPNISAARNAGLALAAGDIVAFIDDDAVPEPTWLTRLTAPFADPVVTAAGGFVRGRNGIAFQWRARLAFADGEAVPITVDRVQPTLLTAGPGRAVKTEGTNMAIRRDVLRDMGGFDPAFAFYLDETDVNLRLATMGAVTAIVPRAEVHHGYAASARRTSDRVPRDLFQIGASIAAFRRKHGDGAAFTSQAARDQQRQRLLGHMVAGRLMPGDVPRLLRTFDAGWEDGLARALGQYPAFAASPPFLRFPTTRRPHIVIGTGLRGAQVARARAARAVADGAVVSLIMLSPTALFHRIRFTDAGVWEQTGGQFGRSDRGGPLVRMMRRKARVAAEMARVVAVRDPFAP